MKDKLELQVPLKSLKDNIYLGTIYLGSPVSQPATVVFDTGSEFLVITSSFCDDDTTPEEYQFRKFDKKHNKFVARNSTQLNKRCLNQAYAAQNSTT